ncbi:jg13099, partial [Pararge aegeria aegeria]
VRCATQCEAGRFGEQCSERCPCANNSSCDAGTGRCVCAAGWRGELCDLPCLPGTYGVACKQICPHHILGNSSCDPVTGRNSCPSGYTGVTCEYPCPLGTYGDDCGQRCNCKNGADCHHVTEVCAGFRTRHPEREVELQPAFYADSTICLLNILLPIPPLLVEILYESAVGVCFLAFYATLQK